MIDSFKFNVILLCSIILLVFFMFGSGLNSEFSIIDDHHVVAEVGSDNKFTLTDGINVLKNDKEFNFDLGSYGRFRPGFTVARTVEMFLFENNVVYYQIARLALFILLMFVLSKFIFLKSDIFSGSLISLILFSERAWHDIFTRILTGEVYVFYGLIVFIPISTLIYNFLKSKTNINLRLRVFILIAYLVSGLLVIGSKENFTFLIIVPAFILFMLFRLENRSMFTNFIGLFSAALVIYGIFILFVLSWYFIGTSDDLSGYGFSDNTLLRILFKFFKIIFLEWGGILLIFPAILLLGFKNKLIIKQKFILLKKDLLKMFGFICLLYLLLLFQVIYYTGGLPSGNRYDIPMIIFYSFYLLVLVHFSKKMLSRVMSDNYVKILLFVSLVAIFITKNPIENIIINSEATKVHVSNTQNYYSTIEKIKEISSNNASKAIIINSFNVWDFELISSFYKFLRANEVNNPLYLKLHYDVSDYESSVERDFVGRLAKISKGNSLKVNPDWLPSNNVLQFGYESLNNLRVVNYECILVNINKQKNDDICKDIVDYDYTGR
jgi:hypothetical protein